MRKDFLKSIGVISQADKTTKSGFVEYGYGQVEPNHLANQATKQTYGQLPAAADITILENGQFAKYNYADGVVNFDGDSEWMLVYNEIKLYREDQLDCEFALKASDYGAILYSPAGGANVTAGGQARDYSAITMAADPYEPDYTNNPFYVEPKSGAAKMPANTKMIPRLIKTEVGDIITTNMILESSLALKQNLAPNANGILATAGEGATMVWQVVKIYTMPDGQQGAKIMRIK